MNRWVLFSLHLISIVLLAFGWFLDLLTIQIGYTVPFLGTIDLMDETRSVFGTLRRLWETRNILPFILIGLFGIIIPLLKTFFIFRILLLPSEKAAAIRKFVSSISKWAMADVFAISILVSFLAANAMDYTKAIIRPGFYYFTGYVLLSNLIIMFLPRQRQDLNNI